MTSKHEQRILYTALLLLKEMVSEVDTEIREDELPGMVARSAMQLDHTERQEAMLLAQELLEEYGYVIARQVMDEDDDTWYEREPVVYDDRIAEVWYAGVRQRKTVRIKYRSEKPETTERLVDPWMTRAPYGIGWCHLRKASRKFRFDRIQQIESTDQVFEKPDDWEALI